MNDAQPLRFEPLAEEHLPLLATWRAGAHVARWFHGALTPEQTRAKFLPRIAGTDPVRGYIVYLHEQPVGYIQSLRVLDHPDVAAAMGITDEAHAVDVLIGDPGATGKGLGTSIVREFTERLLADPAVAYALIAPDTENAQAIRAYEKAGYSAVRVVPSTHDERRNLLMVRRR